MGSKLLCLLFCLTAPAIFASSSSAVVYVDQNAPGPAHDGTSWDTAFLTIQEGLDAATPSGEVWVADGVYVENVVMGEGVAIYGGFLGAEPGGYEDSLDQRDYVNNIATIDGNQSGSCVVMAVSSRVDGFTVTNGSGTPGEYDFRYGGAFYCNDVGHTGVIANNRIAGNSCTHGGGIFTHENASPTIVNNTILGNSASRAGGGVLCYAMSPTLIGNTILSNSATGGGGGGIYCYRDSTPNLLSNVISDNSAEEDGGAIYCYYASPTISNNIVCGNQAAEDGAGLYCFMESSPAVTNNAICSNSAGGNGAGVFFYRQSSPSLTNNVITENSAQGGGGVWCEDGSFPAVSHNDVWGNEPDDYSGCDPGEGDISADPLFVDPENGDYHLSPESPCIDAGWNDAPGLPEEDFEGDPRIIWAHRFPVPYWPHPGYVDIGADEYVPPGALKRGWPCPITGWPARR
jgi:parallel beta-helix repeat protein